MSHLRRSLLTALLAASCSTPPETLVVPAKTVKVALTPADASLAVGGTVDFKATVTGAGTGVLWSVLEASGGSITGAGTYTAPAEPGAFHVVALSEEEPSARAMATVRVVPAGIAVAVNPALATLAPGASLAFHATVTGTDDTSVTWSAPDEGCGSIDSHGLYTAPAAVTSPRTCHVRATSRADATRSADAQVTVRVPAGAKKEAWIWPYNIDTGWPGEIAAIAAHEASFTHLSPTFYSLNLVTTYAGGAVPLVTCPGGAYACSGPGEDDFGTFVATGTAHDGKPITTTSFTKWAHERGFQVVPAIYGGSGNGGSDRSVQAILCGGDAGGCPARTAFVDALVAEAKAKGYDGYNLDWETGTTGADYADAFVGLVNALEAGFIAAGLPDALVTVDAVVSNINGTWCSGNAGWLDFAKLRTSGVDRIILENYLGSMVDPNANADQVAAWTPPTSCATPLLNDWGSAVLNPLQPTGCDFSFGGLLSMMCPPNVAPEVAVIGLMAGRNGNNPIAPQAFAYVESYGFTKVAVWPQFDDWTHPFMSTSEAPEGFDWYAAMEGFLGP